MNRYEELEAEIMYLLVALGMRKKGLQNNMKDLKNEKQSALKARDLINRLYSDG